MVEKTRNFSKFINMLIMPHPRTQVAYLVEAHPFESADKVAELREASTVVNPAVEAWQKEIYDQFRDKWDIYQNTGDVNIAYRDLIEVIRHLGDHFSGNSYSGTNLNCYVPRMRHLLNGPSTTGWFNMDKEKFQPLIRRAYELLRIKGKEFTDLAEELERVENDLSSGQKRSEMERLYKWYLGCYSVPLTQVIRKASDCDDQTPTKNANVSNLQTHVGDNLYRVGIVHPDGESFQWDLIPPKYIRIYNPAYDHSSRTSKYIYFNREEPAYRKVLGLSQSSSDEIELINNPLPAGAQLVDIDLLIQGKMIRVRGFYSDIDNLPPDPVDPICWRPGHGPNGRITWVFMQSEPTGFVDAQHKWAIKYLPKGEELVQKSGNKLAWVEEKPGFLHIIPADDDSIIDEAYLDFASSIQLGTELQENAKDFKTIRIIEPVKWNKNIPMGKYLEHERQNVDTFKHLQLQDGYAGIRYTCGSHEYNIAFQALESICPHLNWKIEDLRRITNPNDPLFSLMTALRGRHLSRKERGQPLWKYITHGRKVNAGNGRFKIKFFGFNNILLGEIPPDKVPSTMHDLASVSEDVTDIRIDVYSHRVGQASWLEIDYGDRFGATPYKKYRFIPLDQKGAK